MQELAENVVHLDKLGSTSMAEEDAVLVAQGLRISADARRVVWIAYADVGWKICDKYWSSNSMSDVSSFGEVSVWCFAWVEWYCSQSVYGLEAVTVATSNSLFPCPKWCSRGGAYTIFVRFEVTHRWNPYQRCGHRLLLSSLEFE